MVVSWVVVIAFHQKPEIEGLSEGATRATRSSVIPDERRKRLRLPDGC